MLQLWELSLLHPFCSETSIPVVCSVLKTSQLTVSSPHVLYNTDTLYIYQVLDDKHENTKKRLVFSPKSSDF